MRTIGPISWQQDGCSKMLLCKKAKQEKNIKRGKKERKKRERDPESKFDKLWCGYLEMVVLCRWSVCHTKQFSSVIWKGLTQTRNKLQLFCCIGGCFSEDWFPTRPRGGPVFGHDILAHMCFVNVSPDCIASYLSVLIPLDPFPSKKRWKKEKKIVLCLCYLTVFIHFLCIDIF